MSIKKELSLIISGLIILLNLNFVIAASFSTTDTFTSDSSSGNDGKTFLDRDLDFTIITSGVMVACYDWYKGCGGGTEYQTCFAANQSDFDDCEAYDSWLTGMGYTLDSTPGTQEMSTSSEANACIDAVYYKDCDGLGGGNKYSVDEREYWIFSRRWFNCESGSPSWYTYDAEGYVAPSAHDYNDEISCPANMKCSEDDDDVWVYTYNGAITNPCRWDNWQSCSVDSDCWSDYCYDVECSNCNEGSQCTSEWWDSCHNFGTLCCDDDATDDQYYCQSNTLWDECTDAQHTGCEQQGSYYCTYESGDWKWRACAHSCSDDSCVEPDIDVSPDPLVFNIG